MINNDDQAFARSNEPADPIVQYLDNLSHAWEKGLETWQVLVRMGTGAQSDHPSAAAAAPIAAMRNMTKSFEPAALLAAGLGGGAEPRQAGVAQMADISPALAEACMAGAASAVRYWGTLAELRLRYEASFGQTVADRTTGRSAA